MLFRFSDADPADRAVPISLRLRPDSRPEAAEFWLLNDRPEVRLAEFVSETDQRILERFAVAVAKHDAETVVLLRGQTRRGVPPVVIGTGLAFASLSKFANCFRPHEFELRPPLRRDMLRQLFAADPATITWLTADSPEGISPNAIPTAAFQPLLNVVDYVVESMPKAFAPWAKKPPFAFLDFAVIETRRNKESIPQIEFDPAEDVEIPTQASRAVPINVVKGTAPVRALEIAVTTIESLPDLPAMPEDELRTKLAERQKAFLDLTGPPDSPERRAMWPELADLLGTLGHTGDAAICWGYALWDENSPANWLHSWLRAERIAAGTALDANRIDRILTEPAPPPEMVRHLAVGLIASLGLVESPHVRARIDIISSFFERHDSVLSMRVAWLAWLAIARITGGDILALARVRDRLLQLLLDSGLSRDRDLPAFLSARDGGGAGAAADHARLTEMHRKARAATAVNSSQLLIDLIFAFGFARAAEPQSARNLLQTAAGRIHRDQFVLDWLYRAYRYRIQCVLEGQSSAGGLPPALLRELAEPANAGHRQAVDRFRRVSRILEPFERIDPYRSFRAYGFRGDTIGFKLDQLTKLTDTAELSRQLDEIRKSAAESSRLRVLASALTYTPRLGEAFAVQVLSDLETAIQKVPLDQNLFQAVDVLESAMMLAAHIGHDHRVPAFYQSLRYLLQPFEGERLAWLVAQLNGQLFRTLSKLGLHDSIGEMVNQLFDQITEKRTLAKLRKAPAVNWGIMLRALLQIAGGWFYAGKDQAATQILAEVQDRLRKRALREEEQTNLAVAYATTLGQSPPLVAWPKVQELFDDLNTLDVPGSSGYHQCVFRTIEATVLAVVAKDFSTGSEVRQWLDEDEQLVRRRIHADMRRALAAIP